MKQRLDPSEADQAQAVALGEALVMLVDSLVKDGDLEPSLAPRGAMLAFLQLSGRLVPGVAVARWLRDTADALEMHASRPN